MSISVPDPIAHCSEYVLKARMKTNTIWYNNITIIVPNSTYLHLLFRNVFKVYQKLKDLKFNQVEYNIIFILNVFKIYLYLSFNIS